MTSLEARIARCARQNLQNGRILFFHFCPETPPFCPKMGPIFVLLQTSHEGIQKMQLAILCKKKKRELHTDVK